MVRPARKEKRKKEKASKEREKKKRKVITHGNGVCQSKNYSGCNDAKYCLASLAPKPVMSTGLSVINSHLRKPPCAPSLALVSSAL